MGVAFGIILGLCGSIAINTGNNLQSLGMHSAEKHPGSEEPNVCSSKTWVIGTVVFITGALLNFASFGFAPQSTLASLESIQFVSNLFFGWWLLHEKITRDMMIGTALTVGGTIFAVVFSSKEAAEVENVEDLVKLWNNYYWIGYIVMLIILSATLHLSYKHLETKESMDYENIMAAIYAIISALFGTLSVVFAKLLAKLVEFQAAGENIFGNWYTYVIVLAWIVLMAFWLTRLNAALGLYNPLFIIPLLQANFIFFAIMSGGIYFQEFNYMIKLNWIGFVFGIICMFSGIFMLVPPKDTGEEETQLRREATFTGGEINTSTVSKFFMTGPGRLNHAKFSIRAKIAQYESFASTGQNMKIMSKNEGDLMKQVCKNYYEGDKVVKVEEEIKNSVKSKAVLSPEEVEKTREKFKKWKDGVEKFEKAEAKIADLKMKVTLEHMRKFSLVQSEQVRKKSKVELETLDERKKMPSDEIEKNDNEKAESGVPEKWNKGDMSDRDAESAEQKIQVPTWESQKKSPKEEVANDYENAESRLKDKDREDDTGDKKVENKIEVVIEEPLAKDEVENSVEDNANPVLPESNEEGDTGDTESVILLDR